MSQNKSGKPNWGVLYESEDEEDETPLQKPTAICHTFYRTETTGDEYSTRGTTTIFTIYKVIDEEVDAFRLWDLSVRRPNEEANARARMRVKAPESRDSRAHELLRRKDSFRTSNTRRTALVNKMKQGILNMEYNAKTGEIVGERMKKKKKRRNKRKKKQIKNWIVGMQR